MDEPKECFTKSIYSLHIIYCIMYGTNSMGINILDRKGPIKRTGSISDFSMALFGPKS